MSTPKIPTQVIILAAGMGIRLRAITRDAPKALVKVAGKPLLDYALDFANALSPEGEHIVVGGYHFDQIEQHHITSPTPYTLIENPAFTEGSILSIVAALPRVKSHFYLLNADHIFSSEKAYLFQSCHLGSISIFCDSKRLLGEDDMKVEAILGDDEEVKSISKTLKQYKYGYIGVTYVPFPCFASYLKHTLKAIELFGRRVSVEQVIQQMAAQHEKIKCHVIDDLNWIEIDTPADYQRANSRMRN